MKFMTWNVNGIRTLTQYHPYCDDLHKNYREILDYLDADVICLQETKITRAKLETDIALVPGYDSYWSFHRTKSGYSGVVIYIKDHIKIVAAEEGISGVLSGNNSIQSRSSSSRSSTPGASSSSRTDSNRKPVGGYPSPREGGDEAAALTRYQELDSEGRGIMLDFGFFVLFNLYCPNETDETRLPFKMDYYHLLEARVRELIKEGREVIVVGDMNVIPTELDHCDPAKWKKDAGEEDFTNTLPRRWFNGFLAPVGPLTDLYRVFHKDEPGAFTCWNTKINARPSNYGTRLDFILVTSGLLPWFKSCDRKPDVVGSDHCPVVAEMFPELVLEKGEEGKPQRLQDILDSFEGTAGHPLAAKFFDEFSGKQQKLSAFFKKPEAAGSSLPSSTLPNTSSPSSSSTSAATSASTNTKRPASLDSHEGQEPRKRSFFTTEKSGNSYPQLSSSEQLTERPSVLIPSPNKPSPKPASRPAQDKGGPKKPASTKESGQRTVLSFFSTTPKKTPDTLDAPPVQAPVSNNTQSTVGESVGEGSQSLTDSASLPELQESPATSSSAPTGSTTSEASTTFSPDDFADWIPGPGDVLPFSINGEATTAKWQSLFQPKAIPKCRFHGVPCTGYTVNKKGPNKGRRFFLCSLPVGPEGDKAGPNPEYRCNYFEWMNPPRKK
ncbi:Class II abasic (AP) endonuclease [Mortierella sp. NVP85]|nr:Class II abasic (AP) endonuclease [Mortierella sp. NVP85]